MKIFRNSFIFLAFLAVAATVAGGQQIVAQKSTGELQRQLQQKLDEWHKAGKFPGATLGVALANGESFGLSVGYSDHDAKTPMRPDDRMLAGSTGKTFAAAVAFQLVGEGKISLDDKIEKYLGKEPWFDRIANSHEITIRQLMNHTSGLVRYEFKKEFTDFKSTFRNGKPGAWKEAFKEHHKQIFKEKFGWALIALGYEADNDW